LNISGKSAEVEQYRKREAQVRKRLNELDSLIQKTFEKNCAGLLPDSMLKNLLSKYELEKCEFEDALSAINAEKLRIDSQKTDIARELENLKQYSQITALNRRIVTSLIETAHVSESQLVAGEKTYEIDIRYKFQNATKKETSFADEISGALCEDAS